MSDKILVVVEHQNGQVGRMTWENVALAQKLGAALGIGAGALVLGSGAEAVARELATKKLAEVLLVENSHLATMTPEGFIKAISQVVEQESPRFLVFGQNSMGLDLAARLAARLDRACATDVNGYRVEDGKVIFTKGVYYGKLLSDLECQGDAPHVISTAQGAFVADDAEAGEAPIRQLNVTLAEEDIRRKVLGLISQMKGGVDLTVAEVIVAGGRGLQKQDNFGMIEDLAAALGAEIGASRPVVDAGWLSRERQVGSSGQVVSPKLYIAVGISGAMQHLVGMKGSKVIVAINKDPNAPIFDVAHYGIVDDLFKVVPALTEAIKARG